MILLRQLVGEVLRRHRLRQERTLRDVSAAAQVSLGYLSEVERGRKEPSSELLAAICAALDVSLAEVLREVSDELVAIERRTVVPVGFAPSHAARVGIGAKVGSSAVATLRTARTAAVPAATESPTPGRPDKRVPVAMALVAPVVAA